MNEEEYNALVSMFESDGWKMFMESVTDAEDVLTRTAVDSAVTNDDWQLLRGRLIQLRSQAGWEQYIRLSYEQSLANEAEDLGDDNAVI